MPDEAAQNESEGSLFVVIKKYGSIMALLIGIFLSFISIFDIFWKKPSESRIQTISEFNKVISSIAQLRQSLVHIHVQGNPALLQASASMVLPQILANLHTAEILLPDIEDDVGIPQLIVLASEAMNIFNWDSAELFIQRAVKIENAPPSLKSEAKRYRGRLFFMTGKYQDARRSYEDALNSIRNLDAYGISGARAFIVADWLIGELSLGDCSIANERSREFIEYVNNQKMLQVQRRGIILTLKAQIADLASTNQQRCPLAADLANLLQGVV